MNEGESKKRGKVEGERRVPMMEEVDAVCGHDRGVWLDEGGCNFIVLQLRGWNAKKVEATEEGASEVVGDEVKRVGTGLERKGTILKEIVSRDYSEGF
ncbi:hypothetical protein SESBI_24818 [Sesbania bispinosa]|nr:hypothetical protein SESBI_24818 [Sesbania bispinosa]